MTSIPWLYNACLKCHLCLVHKWLSCQVAEPGRDKTNGTSHQQTKNQDQEAVKTNGTGDQQANGTGD